MRVLQLLVVFSLLAAVNAFGLDLLLGAAGGLAKGLIGGTMGALGPLAKEGFGTMMDIFGSGMQGAGSMVNGGLSGAENAAGQAIDGVKQGVGGMGSAAQQGMGGLSSMFSSMLKAWMNLMQQFMGAGGSLASALFGMIKSAFMNFFSIFGQLSGGAKGQIGHMYLQTGKTFNAVMKLKLNPQKHQKLIQQEMKAAQKVFETKFDHPQKLVDAFHHHAPQLTSAFKLAFNRASEEFHKHHAKLNPEAKKGAAQMHLQLAHAKFGIGDLLKPLGSMLGSGQSAASSGVSTFFHILQNIMSLVTGLF
ncbi:hypothetical protein M3Y98_00896000 [Aphelenchoides besseyi]|nr:hypothetical protein M3Y98_00896000 [Aphelenchoides besseyi]KAI6193043.1 hypothetical protein M3Y96_00976100 [Aphelenchoides besseyi]